jgi:transcriptional regulator with XRE-family HTH domain
LVKSIYTKRHEQLRKVLRELRLQRELTQQALATTLQRPQSFVAKYERGERRLDVIEFLDVARGLDADPCQILRQVSNKHSAR